MTCQWTNWWFTDRHSGLFTTDLHWLCCSWMICWRSIGNSWSQVRRRH